MGWSSCKFPSSKVPLAIFRGVSLTHWRSFREGLEGFQGPYASIGDFTITIHHYTNIMEEIRQTTWDLRYIIDIYIYIHTYIASKILKNNGRTLHLLTDVGFPLSTGRWSENHLRWTRVIHPNWNDRSSWRNQILDPLLRCIVWCVLQRHILVQKTAHQSVRFP